MSDKHFENLKEELGALRQRVREEGQRAYLRGELVNPYKPEDGAMAQDWHRGWMAGAGQHSSDQMRAYIIYMQTERTDLYKRIEALQAERAVLHLVAMTAHRIMRAADFDMMQGWQAGDVPLGEMVDPLARAFNAGYLEEIQP